MLKIANDFSVSSAPDPSQVAPAHLKEALPCGSDLAETKCADTLRRFVSAYASDGFLDSHAEFLTTAILVPFRKKKKMTESHQYLVEGVVLQKKI